MKNIDDLLDQVKHQSGWDSDYKIAKNLGTVSQHVSNWRRRLAMPSNKHVIAMCQAADIDLGKAILAVEFSREHERPLKEAGFASMGMMGVLGTISGVTLMATSHLPYEALAAGIACVSTVYYVK